MLAKTFTFTDFDGNERTETHYFHLNKAEVMEWVAQNGTYTLEKAVMRMAEERNLAETMNLVKDLIYRSCGRRSLDGRTFDKSEEAKQYFLQSEPYSMLFTELMSSDDAFNGFFTSIMPADLAKEIDHIKDNLTPEQIESIPPELRSFLDIKEPSTSAIHVVNEGVVNAGD